MGVALEGTGVRIEGVRAIEFGNLAEVSEIVIGEFVEHLGQGDGTHFVVVGSARAGRGGNGVEVDEEDAAKSNELFEMTGGGFLMSFFRRMRDESGKVGRVFEHDELGALVVEALNDGHVSEDFDDGPTVGSGLPTEKAGRQVAKQNFEDGGSFFK